MSKNPEMPEHGSSGNAARAPGGKRGSAIIIVLLLIFLLTVSVISFFLLVEDDRQRARSFLDVIRAQIMIESASQEAIAKIMDGSEVPYTTAVSGSYQGSGGGYKYMAQASMAAEPGLMEVRYYNQPPNRGYETGSNAFTSTNAFFQNPFNSQYQTSPGTFAQANPQLIPLFSWKWYAPGLRYLRIANGAVDTTATNTNYNPAVQFNINTSENPFYPGELYLSGLPTATVAAKDAYGGSSGNIPAEKSNYLPAPPNAGYQFQTGESSLDRPVFVQWIPIYQYPLLPPGPSNKVIGRYAYWVDVENTKVNLNTSTRLFDDSAARVMEGTSEADTSTSPDRYFVLGPTTVGSASSATYNRDQVEQKLWQSDSGNNNVNEVELDSSTNDGNNLAAAGYFNLWFGWNPSATNSEFSIPLAADASMVDWRVFTGMRPYGTSGQGTNISVEQLTSAYGTNITNYGAFNTWLEAYSLLDPQVQIDNVTNGELTLATMRRTHSMSTTIYGYEDELDPLGRPKLDIVSFQTQAPGGSVYQELWGRLNDPNYYNAYYPDAFPNNGSSNSFVQSYNQFAGDLTSTNSANGQAVVNQMLVNIYSYAQPHTSLPGPMVAGLTGNTNGVWPAKSMPYVAEVATRARSAMMLLAPSNRVVSNFFTTNASGTNWYSVSTNLMGTDGVSRPNFWYLTNVLVDLGFGFVNPNPFATNTNVTTLTIQAQAGNASFWNVTNVVAPDPTYTSNVVTGASASDTLQGAYALRPSPGGLGSGELGLRATGTNCYFNMGAVPSFILTNTNDGEALQIQGWTLTDGTPSHIYDQVPMANLGQSGAPRSWWQMALTGNNAGPITHMTSLAWFRTGSITNSTTRSNYSYPTFAPPYVNRAVGWFTPKTICEITNANNVTNAIFSGLIYPTNTTYLGVNYGSNVASLTNIPNSAFMTTNWGWYQSLTNQIVQCTNDAMVERVQCVDPVIGHRTGNPANTFQASTATASSYLDTANGNSSTYQIQGAPAASTLAGQFYGVAGHAWRLYDNYVSSSVLTTVAGTPVVTYATNPVTVMIQEPEGVGFITVPYTYNVVTATGTTSGGGGATTNTTYLNPLSCLTKPFDNPNVTRFNQAEWDGTYIPQYGGFNCSEQADNTPNGVAGEASVIFTTNANNVVWPADLENSTVSYAGGGGYFDGRSSSVSGLRGLNNGVDPAATFSTPWGIVDSAPSGQPMTSIGELGFVHSGLIQHPIDLGAVQYLKMANFGGASTNILGSPQNGPPMSMLLDLFTPHAFRNNQTGALISTTESAWASGTVQNTPSDPRRGTVNVNEGVASDYYMAIREGYPTTWTTGAYSGAQGANHGSADPTSMAVRPVWVPTAMFFRNAINPTYTESNLNNNTADGGRLDSFLQPVPRYHRGWDSVISMIGGDFSDFREMGEGAWLGRGGTATDGGVGYMAIGSPLGTWKPGLGSYGGSVFSQFDTSTGYGGASELLTLGRAIDEGPSDSTTWGYFIGNFAADGLSFATSGYSQPFTVLFNPATSNDVKGNLWQATRFAITPLRHFISEIPYDTTGQRDINSQNGLSMSITPDVGNIHTALNMGPPAQSGGSTKGAAGVMNQMGIFSNAFMEQAANMASTSANAFTIHVVAQAINNTGQVRYISPGQRDVGNSGPGYMNTDDQVTAEQWAQIVVERIPLTTAGGDLQRNSTGAPENEYKILYYRILDNAK